MEEVLNISQKSLSEDLPRKDLNQDIRKKIGKPLKLKIDEANDGNNKAKKIGGELCFEHKVTLTGNRTNDNFVFLN